jgi:Sec-independent protein translocase protein TatA
MEIFGIGPLELLLIVFLALIVLGPKDMVETAKKAAAWLRKLRQSDVWKTTKEVMDIPNQVMKETGLEDEIREINNLSQKTFSPINWNGDVPPGTNNPPSVIDATDTHRIDPPNNPAEDLDKREQNGD